MKKVVMVISCLLLLASAGIVGISCGDDDAEDVVAQFLGAPEYGSPPLLVQFSDQSTGEIDTYAWDFGDGETSTVKNPTHTYATIGVYTVKLTVTGPDGSDTETKTDYIEVGDIVAGFSASPTSGTYPLEVQFTDESTGNVTGWTWDFDGDGTTDSTQQNPTHTYDSEDVYTVILEVTGPAGTDTEVKTDYINVEPEWFDTEVTWRLASGAMPNSLQNDQLEAWADLIEQNSRGRMEVKIFAGGSLYGFDAIFDAVSSRAVDLGFTGVTYYIGDMPKVAAAASYANVVCSDWFELNYVQEYLADPSTPNLSFIQDQYEANGVMPLMFGSVGSVCAFFTDPVTSVEDMAGMTLACSPGVVPVVQLYGATAYAMDLADFVTSAEAGTVDGWMLAPLENYANMQLNDVAPYLVHMNLLSVMSVLVNDSSWDNLDEDLQTIVMDAKDTIIADWLAEVTASDEGYLAALADPDPSHVYILSSEERDQWFNAGLIPVFVGMMNAYMSAEEMAATQQAVADAKAAYAALTQ